MKMLLFALLMTRSAIQDAKSFLSTLHPQTQSYELERNISINDDNFKKSERKLNDLREDRKRLDKKINETGTGSEQAEVGKGNTDRKEREIIPIRSVNR
jgi:hypothetical protein